MRGLYFLAVVFAATTIIHFARDCGRLVQSTVRRAGFAFGVSVENYKDWQFQKLVIPISGNSEVVPLGITNITITNINEW